MRSNVAQACITGILIWTCAQGDVQPKTRYFKLKAPIIAALDGLPGMFDGKTIGMIGGNARQFRMMRGTRVDEKGVPYPGPYELRGRKYGTQNLAKLEHEHAADAELQVELQKLLGGAKTDFTEWNRPFMTQIQGIKDKILELMHDSCRQRQIPTKDSFLLKWANTREGDEEIEFRRDINSFNDLDRLLEELCNFMFDLINSCPKGFAQYVELEKQERAKKAQQAQKS